MFPRRRLAGDKTDRIVSEKQKREKRKQKREKRRDSVLIQNISNHMQRKSKQKIRMEPPPPHTHTTATTAISLDKLHNNLLNTQNAGMTI